MCWRMLKSIVEVHFLAELISNHAQVYSAEKWLSRSRTGLKLSKRDVFVPSGQILITYANCILACPGSEKVGNPMPPPGYCSDSGYHDAHFEPALGMSSHSLRPDAILFRSSLTPPQLSTKSF